MHVIRIIGTFCVLQISSGNGRGGNSHRPWASRMRVGDVNTLRPGQNGRHIADDIFECSPLNGNLRISFEFCWKLFPNVPSAIPQHVHWRIYAPTDLDELMLSYDIYMYGDLWITLTKDQLLRKCFHLMTSSWSHKYLFVFHIIPWHQHVAAW